MKFITFDHDKDVGMNVQQYHIQTVVIILTTTQAYIVCWQCLKQTCENLWQPELHGGKYIHFKSAE